MALEKMLPGAECCIEQCANIENGNRILIITDMPIVADALSKAAVDYIKNNNIEAYINTIYLPDSIRPIEKINNIIRNAILNSDIIFTPFDVKDAEGDFCHNILGLASEEGKRKIFHMISVTEDMFEKGGSLALEKKQFSRMKTLTEKIAIILSMAKKVRIQAKSGEGETDIEFDLGDWSNTGIASTGIVAKGSWGNLPSGEAFIIPKGFCAGKIVIDCAAKYIGPIKNSIQLEVNSNGSVDVEKNFSQSVKLIEKIDSFRKKAREKGMDESNVKRICEFGIGTNPNVTGPASKVIEIEKTDGTIHIAIGNNLVFGGDIDAPSHIDMVIKTPTLTIDDDQKIMVNGEIKEENMNAYLKPSYITFRESFNSFGDEIRVFSKNIVKEEDGRLCRFWKDKRNNTYCQQIGCDESAKFAKKMWDCIDKVKAQRAHKVYVKYKRYFNKNIDEEKFFKLINLMERFGILRIRRKKPNTGTTPPV